MVKGSTDPVLLHCDHIFRRYAFTSYRKYRTQLAEDLAAETFYKALANIEKFRWRERSFACWLYTLRARLDNYRKQEPSTLGV